MILGRGRNDDIDDQRECTKWMQSVMDNKIINFLTDIKNG
jgi:hypothetical protein